MGNKGYVHNENMIEWEKNKNKVTLSLTTGKYITKLKKLADEYPNECDIYINEDGSAYGHVPLSYIKISHPPKRELTEEQRLAAAERLRLARAKKEVL